MDKDIQKAVLKVIKDFFSNLGYKIDPHLNPDSPFFSPRLSISEEKGVSVKIPGENLGLLIGFRGETLNSIQTILNILINRKLNKKDADWLYINVDIGNWKQEREDTLINMAQKGIDRAIETGRETPLPPMVSSERRIVHLYLGTLPGIDNRSDGVEPNRKIIIIPKKY